MKYETLKRTMGVDIPKGTVQTIPNTLYVGLLCENIFL